MRFQGRISEWHDDKGYGFISENGTDRRVFLHIKSFTKRSRRPNLGDVVTYEIKVDGKGRSNAERTSLKSQTNGMDLSKRNSSLTLPKIHNGFAIAFIVFLIVMVIFGKLPNGIPAIVIGLSLITFIIYYMDKFAAVKGKRRTPEDTLHVLGLLGGWPGAAFAQKSFRHKCSKRSFQIKFLITVALNSCFILWLSIQIPERSILFELLSF